MQAPHNKENTAVNLLIVVLCGVVFAVDCVTTLGVAVWVFYLVPLVLTVLQSRRGLPILTALAIIALIGLGYTIKPEGLGGNLPLLNRGAGSVAILVVAWLAERVIGERMQARRLLWLQAGQTQVGSSLLGEPYVDTSGRAVLATLARYLNAQIGVMQRLERGTLVPAGTFGVDGQVVAAGQGSPGSNLAAEVARSGESIIVRDLPDHYVRVQSMLGETAPRHLVVVPITVDKRPLGVIELGFVQRDARLEDKREFLELVGETVGVAIRAAAYREHLKALLEQTQRQSEELQVQQEELRVSNEELEEQGRALRESQARLENQHAELEQTNVQLEEHTQRLDRQKQDLMAAQRTLQVNAQELTRANQYKSEFLANMSHELRTPLNSSLILSQILSDAKSSLSVEQVREYAQTIHASNNDLLTLINDILDLSKIEAGHVDLDPEPMSLVGLLEPMRQQFAPIAADRGLAFTIEVDDDAPTSLVTDRQRLQQILKNLLSNAFKFTEQGSVRLRVKSGAAGKVAFAVRDSGIGIPDAQQQVIFEAFRQADGTTSRKYGGTGLGLSISRELARRLGGDIAVQSTAGEGSVFTVQVAIELETRPREADDHQTESADDRNGTSSAIRGAAMASLEPMLRPTDGVHARRGGTADGADSSTNGGSHAATRGNAGSFAGMLSTQPEAAPPTVAELAHTATQRAAGAKMRRERLILLIEDDERFAAVIRDLARDLNFDFVHAISGDEAMKLARELVPAGILLDVNLPDQSGLSILDQLKRDPETRHIPIHMLSVEDHTQTALELGAIGYALKPVAREELMEAFAKVEEKLKSGPRRVLVVEDDETLRENITLLLKADDVEIVGAATGAEALKQVSERSFDCVVMDLMLPDASGYELLEQMASGGKYAFPPVIVYTGRALSRDEEQRLRRYSRSIIIKGAKSPERLMDEVSLFLHRVEATLPPDQQKLLLQARQRDTVFEGRKILLAEDDVRNIFALSRILEPLGAQLVITRNGREAVEYLQGNGEADLVLMDLMMPEMDGLTAMRHIRRDRRFEQLPIIALTAKAMADDRRNCLEAGANDYIAKPIDVDKLVSLCRVWMSK